MPLLLGLKLAGEQCHWSLNKPFTRRGGVADDIGFAERWRHSACVQRRSWDILTSQKGRLPNFDRIWRSLRDWCDWPGCDRPELQPMRAVHSWGQSVPVSCLRSPSSLFCIAHELQGVYLSCCWRYCWIGESQIGTSQDWLLSMKGLFPIAKRHEGSAIRITMAMGPTTIPWPSAAVLPQITVFPHLLYIIKPKPWSGYVAWLSTLATRPFAAINRFIINCLITGVKLLSVTFGTTNVSHWFQWYLKFSRTSLKYKPGWFSPRKTIMEKQ